MKAAYGMFYEPYYTGNGGPLQSPDQRAAISPNSAQVRDGPEFICQYPFILSTRNLFYTTVC